MARYLMTHSLLASWLYALKENPYEDATSDKDPLGEFIKTLFREPTPPNEAMQSGIDFENLVTDIIRGEGDPTGKWYDAASKVASRCSGGTLQYKARKTIEVAGEQLLLYGRLDCLKAGEIIDIKFSKGYDRGKYFTSTQHPVYMELVPEASSFTYLVSNGTEVWSETYRRDETPSVYPIIEDFLSWLRVTGWIDVYHRVWAAL